MICDNIEIRDNKLYFAGRDTTELAEKYSTPVYLFDEQRIRANMRLHIDSMERHFKSGRPLYASKAMSCKRIYEIAREEGMGVDVVSLGELAYARAAGYPLENVWFHGNAKTDADISTAMDWGIGGFVADSFEELYTIDNMAGLRGIKQDVLLRVTPGIDPHTLEAVSTGKLDSKFGVPIETGEAEEYVAAALKCRNLNVRGLHAHVGSQVFDSQVFYDMADIMIAFLGRLHESHGFEAEILNLGGGYGVRYVDSDPFVDIDHELSTVAEHVEKRCAEFGIKEPCILMEPGRSIVADAGMTLYTVQNVRSIKDHHSYVAVDGGMGDNPRFALYGAEYTVIKANGAEEEPVGEFQLVGRFCESGDVIKENAPLPACKRGDIIAVCTTGAYNHTMASNYNGVSRPPVVMIDGERDYVAVRRETLEDLLIREM